MSRPRGGFIGHNPAPAASALNSAAGGIWTLREAEELKRAGTWPTTDFTPDVLSGLQLWLDASDASTLYDATTGGSLVAADGGVARWEDKSGNGRHATQGTAGRRPTRKTTIQGGLDVLRFDGSDDSLSVPSSTATFKFLHSQNSSMFFVFTRSSTASSALLDNADGGTGGTGVFLFFSNGSETNDKVTARVVRGQSGTEVADNTSGNGFISGGWNVLSLVHKPADASAAERSAARRNGGSPEKNNAATSAVSTSNASKDLAIARFASFPTEQTHGGDIAEIIIYDSALSDTDREAVENYLLAKWSIT